MPENFRFPFDEIHYIRIFTASAAMVGVCLIIVGVLRLLAEANRVDAFARNLTAVDALVFLASGLLSYAALRARKSKRRIRAARAADFVFTAALFLLSIVCALIFWGFASGR